jgi:hypothetical protein
LKNSGLTWIRGFDAAGTAAPAPASLDPTRANPRDWVENGIPENSIPSEFSLPG